MKGLIRQIDIKRLRPHERTEPGRLKKLVCALRAPHARIRPIIVDRGSYTILDGHHRYQAFVRLGIPKISCLLVDYFDKDISVTFRRADVKNRLTKEIIINTVKKGKLFPYKTTKHRLPFRPAVRMKIL